MTDSYLDNLGNDSYYSGVWDCKGKQININGALWDVHFISAQKIELRACEERYEGQPIIKDYYCLLIKQ